MKNILILGASGQIGSHLVEYLEMHHNGIVVATDIIARKQSHHTQTIFKECNCLNKQSIQDLITEYNIDTIVHLSALLSFKSESIPIKAWHINMEGLINSLEVARLNHLSLFFPSSIGVFGPSTPKESTPQETIMRPNTMYGITKLSGELLCQYYFEKFHVNVRSIRFPGIISPTVQLNGGTTDYACEMLAAAKSNRHYICYLNKHTQLDMIHITDAIKAMISLMTHPNSQLKTRNGYNITGIPISPHQLSQEINKYRPEFTTSYTIDPVRQQIADSWPNHINDDHAKLEWNWQPAVTLESMVKNEFIPYE